MAKQRLTFALFLFLCFSLSLFGQKNVTKPNVQGPMGFKVNTYTGNLFYQRQDLFIPGRGLDVDFTFTYNSSKRNQDWGMGKGWTFMYNMAYELEGADVVVERMDGRKDHFAFNSGSYQAPAGLYDVLEQYEVGKYRIRMKDGTRYFFDNPAHRRLTKVEDRNGNAITLSYTDSLITAITDASGRDVSLAWTGGHLASITFSGIAPARAYQYEYDNGQLFRMTNSMGFMVQYQYDDRGRMKEMVDENGNPITILYDDRGAVKALNSCLSSMSIAYNLTNRKTYVVEKAGQGEQVTTYQYDDQGRLASQTGNCCGYNLAFEYDEDNNVAKRTDANGNATVFNYDGRGNVVREVDPLGNILQFTYEPEYNKITSIVDKKGNTTGFIYDPNGNLTHINYPLGFQESYSYDAFGNQTGYTDGEGNPTAYEYNEHGYLTQITNAANGFTQFSYDSIGNLVAITDPNTNVTTLEYDALNRLVSQTDALNHTETYDYDNRRNRTSVTDKGGNTTLYTYDALDRLIIEEDALGQQATSDFDEKGNLIKYTDENGHETQYAYDNLNRLGAITNAEGEAINYEYDGNGNVIEAWLANGNAIQIQYDGLDRVISVTDALGAVSSFAYDKNSNQTSITDGVGNTTTYEYDVFNRLAKITDPSGNSIEYAYDGNNNLVSILDQNGNLTSYIYDELDRQTGITDALNNSSGYSYDAFGNLTSVTDQNNHTTSYTYDALNRLETQTHPDGTDISYSYNATGQVVQRTDESNQTITYQYDDIYLLANRTYPDNSTDAFTYDGVGNILTATNASAVVEFSYDKVNRTTSETLNGKTTWFTYDIQNRQRSISYPGGRQIIEQLDERARLKSIIDSTFIQDVVANYEFDLGNRIKNRSYFNGAYTDYSYDSNFRLTSLTHTLNNIYRFNYAYDNIGNRIKEEKMHQPSASRQFIYDDLYRLIISKSGMLSGNLVVNPISETQFNLDALGNRLSVNSDGEVTTYTTNELNQYVDIANNVNFSPSYDNNGNLMSDGAYDYSFDYENRLVEVDNGLTAKYHYDALGRRIRKIINLDTSFYYFDNLRVIEERINGDIVDATYVYGSNIDEVLTMHREDAHFFYHEDGLGSITQITNENGWVLEQIEYDAFGKPTFYDANFTQLNTSAVKNPYLFTGRRFDNETGLYFFRSRYYSTKFGRFVQRDPLGFVDGLSLYNYVWGNPVNWVDPLGLLKSPCDKPLWKSSLDGFQTGLDVIGAVPFIGEPFDLVNAGIYTVRGDYGLAALSLGAMIPIGGQVFTAGKLGTKYGDDVLRSVAKSGDDISVVAKRKPSTLKPGPHAGKSIPAKKGKSRNFSKQERNKINEIGNKTGCHTCGTKDAGTKSGNFIPDHQPPNATAPDGIPQRLYPHCKSCSASQGGTIRSLKKR